MPDGCRLSLPALDNACGKRADASPDRAVRCRSSRSSPPVPSPPVQQDPVTSRHGKVYFASKPTSQTQIRERGHDGNRQEEGPARELGDKLAR